MMMPSPQPMNAYPQAPLTPAAAVRTLLPSRHQLQLLNAVNSFFWCTCTQGGPSPLMDSPTSPTDAQPEDGKALEGGAELEPSDKQAAQVFESALEPEPQVPYTFGAF